MTWSRNVTVECRREAVFGASGRGLLPICPRPMLPWDSSILPGSELALGECPGMMLFLKLTELAMPEGGCTPVRMCHGNSSFICMGNAFDIEGIDL